MNFKVCLTILGPYAVRSYLQNNSSSITASSYQIGFFLLSKIEGICKLKNKSVKQGTKISDKGVYVYSTLGSVPLELQLENKHKCKFPKTIR